MWQYEILKRNDGTMVVKTEDIFHNEHQVGKGGSQLQGGIYEAFFGKGGVRNTNVSDDAISWYAKKGNGYARITLIK